jgi:hypothetical protein
MDLVFDAFGLAGTWPLLLLGVALAAAGLVVRAGGRRQAELAARAQSGRRRLGQLTPGPCTVEGAWRLLDDGRALLEDETGAAALLAWEAPPPLLPERARVLVVGVAGAETDDPRGAAGYRGSARVVRLAVAGGEQFITDDLRCLERLAERGRRALVAGGACFACGLGLAAAALVIFVRAAGLS